MVKVQDGEFTLIFENGEWSGAPEQYLRLVRKLTETAMIGRDISPGDGFPEVIVAHAYADLVGAEVVEFVPPAEPDGEVIY